VTGLRTVEGDRLIGVIALWSPGGEFDATPGKKMSFKEYLWVCGSHLQVIPTAEKSPRRVRMKLEKRNHI
jgi:hypothetical protein